MKTWIVSCVLWIGILGWAVLIGVTSSPWAGVMLVASTLLVAPGTDRTVVLGAGLCRRYWVYAILGVAGLGGACWIDGMSGGWLWSLPWLWTAVLLLVSWRNIFRCAPAWQRRLVVSAACASSVLALYSPFARTGLNAFPGGLPWVWPALWVAGIAALLFYAPLPITTTIDTAESESRRVPQAAFPLLLLCASVIVVLATGNMPAALIVTIALWLLFKDMYRIAKGVVLRYRHYLVARTVGLLLLLCAMRLDAVRQKWLWALLLLCAVAPLWQLGGILILAAKRRQRWRGNIREIGLIVTASAGVLVLAGISLPWFASVLGAGNLGLLWWFLAPALYATYRSCLFGLDERPVYFLICIAVAQAVVVPGALELHFAGRWIWPAVWGILALGAAFGALGLHVESRSVAFAGWAIALLQVALAVNSVLNGARDADRLVSLMGLLGFEVAIWTLFGIALIVLVIVESHLLRRPARYPAPGYRWHRVRRADGRVHLVDPEVLGELTTQLPPNLRRHDR